MTSMSMYLATYTITYAFYFAILAEINTGVIPCLFNMSGLFNAVIFYIKFKETFSVIKGIGMAMMFICIACLVIESSEKETGSQEIWTYKFTKEGCGFMSVFLGCLSPVLFTTQTYFNRLAVAEHKCHAWDLGIDTIIVSRGL